MERREGSNGISDGGHTPLKEVKKSYSFGGYGLLPGLSQQEELSLEEVKLLFAGSPREPSKSTKERIKLLATKYRDVECVGAGASPWYENLRGKDCTDKLMTTHECKSHQQPQWRLELKELAQQINIAPLLMVALTVLIAVRLCPVPWHVSERYTAHAHATYTVLVSASFGTECWMTFFSGVALFFSVPRHVFAQVQIVLFPLYFLVKAAMLLLALVCLLLGRRFQPSSTSGLVQSSLLTLALLTNVLVRLCLAPHLTRLIAIKMAIEKEEGLGEEVGSTAPGRLKHCPHYMKLHRAFRRVHSAVAVANMLSLTCTAILVSYHGLQR